MFMNVRSLNTIIFSYLTEYHRKTDDLVIEADIELLFFGIKIKVRQKIIFHLFFYCYFLLHKANHVGLINHKLRLGYFIAMNYLLFHLYYVLIRLLFIDSFGRFMNQTQLMGLITYQECLKVRKYFKISNNFIDTKTGYFKCSLASVDCEHSYCFLVITTKIKHTFLFRIFQFIYNLMMRIFDYFCLAQTLVVKIYFVTGDNTYKRKRYYF